VHVAENAYKLVSLKDRKQRISKCVRTLAYLTKICTGKELNLQIERERVRIVQESLDTESPLASQDEEDAWNKVTPIGGQYDSPDSKKRIRSRSGSKINPFVKPGPGNYSEGEQSDED